MNYSSLVRLAASLADSQTADMQDTVSFSAWIGSGTYGEPIFAAPINIQAIVEEKQYTRRLPDGSEITQKATITIPRPIAPNGATDRREPIDPRDKFVLPSGFTGPIQFVNGTIDPSTHAPYSFEIVLG